MYIIQPEHIVFKKMIYSILFFLKVSVILNVKVVPNATFTY